MQEIWVLTLGREDPLEKAVLQYSCLENPMDRGTWKAAVHGVAESWTRLNDFLVHTFRVLDAQIVLALTSRAPFTLASLSLKLFTIKCFCGGCFFKALYYF